MASGRTVPPRSPARREPECGRCPIAEEAPARATTFTFTCTCTCTCTLSGRHRWTFQLVRLGARRQLEGWGEASDAWT